MTKRNWLGTATIALIFLGIFVSSHGLAGIILFVSLVALIAVVVGLAAFLTWCFSE